MVLGVFAVGLVIVAVFLLINFPSPASVKQPIVVAKNEIVLYPGGARFGPFFSFGMWTLTVQNNSNETQRLVASLLARGLPSDFQSITLSPSQHISQTNCEGAVRNGSNFTESVIVTSGTGSFNFNLPVTTSTATSVPFDDKVVVTNSLMNSSATLAGRTGGDWNMTIMNNGTKPVAFFYATLYDPSAIPLGNPPSDIYSFSSCPYPTYYGGQSRTVSPQSPLVQGQSVTVSSPTFFPGISVGKPYSIDYVVGYSDGTAALFTTTIQVKG